MGDVLRFYFNANSSIQPASDNSMYLGMPTFRFKGVYSASGVSTTSDKNKKTDIQKLDEETTFNFVMGLIACSYKHIDGNSGRRHWGFIAQDIEELLKKLGIDPKDFAGFIKSPKMKEVRTENKDGTVNIEFVEIPGEYDYSLRYEQFTPALATAIQVHQREIEKLKKGMKKQKEETDKLKGEIEKLKEALGLSGGEEA